MGIVREISPELDPVEFPDNMDEAAVDAFMAQRGGELRQGLIARRQAQLAAETEGDEALRYQEGGVPFSERVGSTLLNAPQSAMRQTGQTLRGLGEFLATAPIPRERGEIAPEIVRENIRRAQRTPAQVEREVEASPTRRLGGEMVAAAPEVFPTLPGVRESLPSQVSGGIGSVAALLPAGLTGPAAPFVGGAMYGLSAGEDFADDAEQVINSRIAEALAQGNTALAADLERRKFDMKNTARMAGRAIGAGTEGVLGLAGKIRVGKSQIGGIGARLADRMVPKSAPVAVQNAVRGAVEGGLTEAAQEGTEQILGNAAALAVYDPNRGIMDDVAQSVVVGGLTGKVVGGAFGSRGQNRDPLPASRAAAAGEVVPGTEIPQDIGAPDLTLEDLGDLLPVEEVASVPQAQNAGLAQFDRSGTPVPATQETPENMGVSQETPVPEAPVVAEATVSEAGPAPAPEAPAVDSPNLSPAIAAETPVAPETPASPAPSSSVEGVTGSVQEIRNQDAKLFNQWQSTVEAAMDPMADSLHEANAKTVPESTRDRFTAHGLRGFHEDTLASIIANGLTRGSEGPVISEPLGGRNTKSGAPLILLSKPDKTIQSAGIGAVVVNRPWANQLIPALQKKYPGVLFISPQQLPAYLNQTMPSAVKPKRARKPKRVAIDDVAGVEAASIPLGVKRPPVVDTALESLSDEEFSKLRRSANKNLERLEKRYDAEDPTLNIAELAAAQDAFSSVDLELFRRRIRDRYAPDLFRELVELTDRARDQKSDASARSRILISEINRQGVPIDQLLSELDASSPDKAEVLRGQFEDLKLVMGQRKPKQVQGSAIDVESREVAPIPPDDTAMEAATASAMAGRAPAPVRTAPDTGIAERAAADAAMEQATRRASETPGAAAMNRAPEEGIAPAQVAQPNPEPEAQSLTPKQYHKAVNAWRAKEYGVPVSDVEENYPEESNKQDHWSAVNRFVERGGKLDAKILDSLDEEQIQYLQRSARASIPEGYLSPAVRAKNKAFEREMVDARKRGREEAKREVPTPAPAPMPEPKPKKVKAPTSKANRTFKALKAKAKPVGDGLYEIPKLTPAQRAALRDERGRMIETDEFILRDKADVTGTPSDNGYILRDKAEAGARRVAATPEPTITSTPAAETPATQAAEVATPSTPKPTTRTLEDRELAAKKRYESIKFPSLGGGISAKKADERRQKYNLDREAAKAEWDNARKALSDRYAETEQEEQRQIQEKIDRQQKEDEAEFAKEGKLTTQQRVDMAELREVQKQRGKLGVLNSARLAWLESKAAAQAATQGSKLKEPIGKAESATEFDKWLEEKGVEESQMSPKAGDQGVGTVTIVEGKTKPGQFAWSKETRTGGRSALVFRLNDGTNVAWDSETKTIHRVDPADVDANPYYTPTPATGKPQPDILERALNAAIKATDPGSSSFSDAFLIGAVGMSTLNAALRIVRRVYLKTRDLARAKRQGMRLIRRQLRSDKQADLPKIEEAFNQLVEGTAEKPGPDQIEAFQAADGTRRQKSRGLFTGDVTVDTDAEWQAGAERWINQFNGNIRRAFEAARSTDYATTGLNPAAQDYVFGRLLELTEIQANAARNDVDALRALNLQKEIADAMRLASSEAGKALGARALVQNRLLWMFPVLNYRNLIREAQKRLPFPDVVADEVRTWLQESGRKAVQEMRNAMTDADKVFARELKTTVRDMRVVWRDVMTASVESQEAMRRKILEELVKAPELKGLSRQGYIDIANLLGKAWEKERARIFAAEFRKQVPLPSVKEDVRRKLFTAIPDILKWANLGLLDNEAFRNAVAPKFGVAKFDGETAKKLNEMAQQAQRVGGVNRNRIIAEMYDTMQREGGVRWPDIVRDYWYAAVLGAVNTQVDNALGVINGALNTVMGMAMSPPEVRKAMGKAYREGFGEAIADFFPILWRGDVARAINFNPEQPANTLNALSKSGNLFARGLSVGKYVSRLMTALDQINALSTDQAMKAYALGRRLPVEHVRRYMMPSENVLRTARLKAEAEGTPPNLMRKRVREIVQESIPVEVLISSKDIRELVTFTNQPKGLMGALYRGVQEMEKKAPGFKVLSGTNFLRFAANYSNEILNYVAPVALYRYYVSAPSRAEGRLGLKMGQEERQLILAKLAVGTALGTFAAALFLGDDDDEKDRKIDITGSFKSLDPNKRKQLLSEGRSPYSIRIGDKYVSYRQLPFGGVLGAIGELRDRQLYNPKEWNQESIARKFMDGAFAGSLIVRDSPAISSFTEFLGTANAYKYDMNEQVEKSLPKYIARLGGSFIPRIAKEIDAWADPAIYKANTGHEFFLQQMPIFRRELGEGPVLNVLGEPVQVERYPWSRWVKTRKEDKAWSTLGELASKGVFLPVPSVTVKVMENGRRREMTPAESYRYQQRVGQAYRKFVEDNSDRLLRMKPDEAADFIDTQTERIRSRIRSGGA